MVEKFKEYLTHSNMAKNTVSAYIYAVNDFNSRHKELTKKNLLLYKTYLIETFKPKTVNLRIQALNKYLEYLRKPRLRLKSVKVQQRTYLENVISNADYIFLKNKLKKEDNQEWYFVRSHRSKSQRISAAESGACKCGVLRHLHQRRQDSSPVYSQETT